jgi:hypothetical protein
MLELGDAVSIAPGGLHCWHDLHASLTEAVSSPAHSKSDDLNVIRSLMLQCRHCHGPGAPTTAMVRAPSPLLSIEFNILKYVQEIMCAVVAHVPRTSHCCAHPH